MGVGTTGACAVGAGPALMLLVLGPGRSELDLGFLAGLALELVFLGTFVGTVALVMYSQYRTRRRFREELARDGEGVSPENAELFLSRLGRSMMGSSSTAVLVVVVLFFSIIFTLAFVYAVIGDYAFAVFALFVALVVGGYYYQIRRLNGLDELDRGEYGFLHDHVDRVCDRYDVGRPRLVRDDDPNVNALTTSFMGRRSVVVFTRGLLDIHHEGRLSDEQLSAIVGHEVGHIVNSDATINTLLDPMIKFIQGVLYVLRFIAVGIYRVMVATVRVGTSSLLGLAIAVGVLLLLVLLLILVGVYLVMFFLVVYAVGLCWNAFKRQQEYSADLFAALSQRTSRHIGLGLLELTRWSGLNGLKASILEEEIKQRAAEGAFAHMSRAEVEARIDDMIEGFDVEQHVRDDPGSIASVREVDARHLLERRGLDPFTDEDLREFATFEYPLGERVRELVYTHPLSGKRVSGVADVSFE